MEKKQQDLKKGLLPRHVQFIALAGMIGTGIFKGSSDTLSIAGPSVVLAYLLGGLLLLIVMVALGEMAIAHPGMNVQHLVNKAFGHRVSFIVGWLYWINWVIVTTVELLAGGSFLQYWFPNIPLWLLSFLCAAVILGINSFHVKFYGELEFWFAGIKIFALIAFIILGCLILSGILPSSIDNPISNYTSHGGFFPHGIGGIFSAFLVVMFSYGGAELIGVAVTETQNAKKVLPKIVKGTVWRVIIFYICPILIICGIVPWDKVSGVDSPFVQVFSTAGLPGAANIMNFVLLTAVLSAANSGIYATSRTLFSMAQTGEAPKLLLKVSKNGTPINGILITGFLILIGVFLAYLAPENIINYMMTIPGFTIMLIWISICFSQLKLRPQYKEKPFFQVKWFPFTTILALIGLITIFISFMFNAQNKVGTIVCLIILLLLVVFSLKHKK
ncbi:GABA permease (4-amino butyrate transport carrier) [Heyndrickxia shackletonii]|uniref:GABA permease (4-amino butyrate transport carrier) n=1 Tax=Heyndrickxia shackletonii TaxID=157838 RepID=A0A0Q3WXY8_9BACI|nr:amino acid permease [Heyndrickxia shackletonii]KQL53933.1 GABA permease (4-amino butyrate transport carrier) [Heyndrickxia shackletonii]MBB2478900.1 amino acid permease [Bacillus sp. APMAM]NEY97783.1 amino acid permease [Heyndrickxia shackletonii]RTZ57647.1 amino acid permease [Bacillus sp. SAJ1]